MLMVVSYTIEVAFVTGVMSSIEDTITELLALALQIAVPESLHHSGPGLER